jgi:hypothetical protein
MGEQAVRMAEPILRCGQCLRIIDPLEDWCMHCGQAISLDDVRAVYDHLEDGKESIQVESDASSA